MPPPRRGWWQRHWTWALPVTVLTFVVLAAAFVAIVLFAIRGSMLRSDVYADALARARAHPRLVATLGTPITAGFMPTGSISTSTDDGGSGRADLLIGIDGPRGAGRLIATAERRQGAWTWELLLYVSGDDERPQLITIAEADTPVEPHALPAP
ncbi:cytochrome c oxidase assembly factor Coa1 family protein [Luteimonas rhizosphaerae]|uniref:cytochrome c oxidase assembly factor Coa1 family protein n=1 Tax=Luteimonas sp. 4-12 TaxID=2027406 RepID=UPI0013044880|nr:cytochrome c oxidase assembly factor Coa1 family protein [Luteimonas sp. 4-12]